ncbi:MAG: flavin reductase family protein [Bacteroidia bacterium]|nr:flavin reductase family protein [Bacteroidia bacterium]MDW8347522.1 flavin reductase family protein [Bacteroidia bacterium]
MTTFIPKEQKIPFVFNLLQSAVAPRPIAFVSTINLKGQVNLSPFSFFNIFSVNPPILVFSPSRRVRDNTTKHTLQNVEKVPECVINVVSYDMVEQVNLASTEYPEGVNEFVKAGFTEQPSIYVKPPRVKESPVQMECKVKQIIPLGELPGSGNLVISEVVAIHVREDIPVLENGAILPDKIELVSRLGLDFYGKAYGSCLFELAKPLTSLGIGIDNIPEPIRYSSILTGNDLGKLGNIAQIPTDEDAQKFVQENNYQDLNKDMLHTTAKHLLSQNKVQEAWKVLVYSLQK